MDGSERPFDRLVREMKGWLFAIVLAGGAALIWAYALKDAAAVGFLLGFVALVLTLKNNREIRSLHTGESR